MKKIPLTRGKFALVDDQDYEWLNQWAWQAHLDPANGVWYAVSSGAVCTDQRKISADGYNRFIRRDLRMHRLIQDVTNPKIYVDHCDHDGLNNQRYNLRNAASRQNQQNRIKRRDCASKYKGVTWHGRQNWYARVTVNGKRISLGYFTDERDAAQAYNWAAALHFGEFAHFNVGDQW